MSVDWAKAHELASGRIMAGTPRHHTLPAVQALLAAVNAGCLLIIQRRGERQVRSHRAPAIHIVGSPPLAVPG